METGKTETDRIEQINKKLKSAFQKIKVVYYSCFPAPLVFFITDLLLSRGTGHKVIIDAYAGSPLRLISLIFIMIAIVEYYAIVILMRKISGIIGDVDSVENFLVKYRKMFVVFIALALLPSILGFFYYLVSADIVLSSLFYIVGLVSCLRIYPRFRFFRDLYIDLSEEEI